jgi:hypothetical protein
MLVPLNGEWNFFVFVSYPNRERAKEGNGTQVVIHIFPSPTRCNLIAKRSNRSL